MDRSTLEAEWARLMRAALDGDESAYRALLGALVPVLRSSMRRGLARAGRGTADAEDLVQETLLALHLKRHTWRRGEPIGPWLGAIARHKLVDALRRRGGARHVPLDDVLDDLGGDESAEPRESPDVDRLLDTLQARPREIVRAVAIEGCSAREVGARLGMSEGAVRVALHRALRALAARLRREPGGTP